jgi:hypothetical protein
MVDVTLKVKEMSGLSGQMPPLMLDLLAKVYKVGSCFTYLKCVTLRFLQDRANVTL